MSVREKLSDFNEIKILYETKSQALKLEFEEFIIDQNIHLMERWNTYIYAPPEMKNQGVYIYSGETKFFNYLFFDYFKILDDSFYCIKFYMEDIFSDIYVNEKIDIEKYMKLYKDITEQDIENTLEEILRKNVDSFYHDW